MKVEIRSTSDDYEISSIVKWQVWEGLKGKKYTICNQPFTPKDKSAIVSGKDENGELTSAHTYCWNRQN